MRGGSHDLLGRLAGGVFGALLVAGVLSFGAGTALAKIEPTESRAYYEKAIKLVDQGNLRAAVIELKNALQRDPGNGQARLLLGEVYLQIGDGASAEKELKAAERNGIEATRTAVPLARAMLLQGHFKQVLSDFEPDGYGAAKAFELKLIRAEAQAGLRDFATARSTYEDAAKSNPSDARVPLGLARLDMVEGKLDAATAHASDALKLDPKLQEANLVRAEALRLNGKIEDSLADYRSILDGTPAPKGLAIRAHLGLAAAFIGLKRDGDAAKEVAAAQADAPKSPLAAYLDALIKVRAHDFAAARKTLDAAAPALGSFPPAQFLFGVVYFSAGEFETARSWLARHLGAHPENLQARKLLGATLLRLNAPDDAAKVLAPGLKQAPDDPQVLLLIGNAYIRTGRAEEASKLLQRAAELAPKDPRVLSQLAISQMATGKNDEALASLNTTLDLGADASVIGYALAFSHLRAGQFDDALKVAQSLRKRFPNSAVAANLEGGAYAALGQLDKARESFKAVLDIDPKFQEARANLAALKARTGDIDGAEAEYQKILDADKSNIAGMLGMAAVTNARGDKKGARSWLVKAVDANPKAVKPAMTLVQNYAAAGEFPAAVEVLSKLSEQQPNNPQVLAELGAMQIKAGKPADAVETYKQVVELTKESADARILLAQAQVAAGEPAAGRQTLEEALADDPSHAKTAEALARMELQLEGPEATLAYVKGLRRLYPDAPWADQLTGDLEWHLGHVDEARKAYEAAWTKHPSAGVALALSRARLKDLGPQSKYAKTALTPLEDWLKQHPQDDTVRLGLAESLLSIGDLDGARAQYETLKKTQANNPIVWNNLAWLYQQTGDSRAVAHGERALALAPGQPAMLDTLGWILVGDGQIARATTLLQKANKAAPKNGDIAYHYAAALHKGGDDAAARQVLQPLLDSGQAFASKSEAAALLAQLSK